MKKIALILAGGTGEKFWPKSTSKLPKQFHHFIGDATMLENTFNRLLTIFDKKDIYVISNKEYFIPINNLLPNLPKANIILEPYGRNTAPALMMASILLIDKYSSDTVIAAFPSDHVISNAGEFQLSVENACQAAYRTDKIITIGIDPTRPETQYGYIQIKSKKEHVGDLKLFRSRTIAEKPDINTAKLFLESGDFLWNSGMFFSRMDSFENHVAEYLPFHHQKFAELKSYIGTGEFIEQQSIIYKQINSISLDYGILEKTKSVLVVEANFSWSDLVTWDELFRLSMKDGQGNFAHGEVVMMQTKDSMILAKDKMIAVSGLSGIIIVESDDAIFICPKGDTEKVQEIVDYMRRKQLNKFL